jgi:hypothetical protein
MTTYGRIQINLVLVFLVSCVFFLFVFLTYLLLVSSNTVQILLFYYRLPSNNKGYTSQMISNISDY